MLDKPNGTEVNSCTVDGETRSRPVSTLFFELRFESCPHTITLPVVLGADCKKHCFICMPELREQTALHAPRAS